jgi:hypothetical protein
VLIRRNSAEAKCELTQGVYYGRSISKSDAEASNSKTVQG